MELVYLWVEEYKNIKNQGFNFSPRFTCDFKAEYEKYTDENGKEKERLKDKCELVINPKEFVENFFGENINITAIVGENGSGKSSVLEFLAEIFRIEYNKNRNLIVDTEHSNKFSLAFKIKDKTYKIKSINNHDSNTFNEDDKIENILDYYVYSSDIKIKNQLLFDNSSIAKMIVSNYSQSENFQLSSFMYLPTKIEIRLCDFERKFVQLITNDKLYPLSRYERDDIYIKNTSDEQQTQIANFESLHNDKYFQFLILILIEHKEDTHDFNLTKEKVEDTLKAQNIEVISEDDFNRYFKISEELGEMLAKEVSALEKKEKEVYIDKYSDFFEYDFIDEKNRRYSDLSHGEKTLFGQLLNIYYNSQKSKNDNLLFLFDEPEISLHPNWQKNYINELSNLLIQMKKNYHFIFTSHSPFLLSDLPKENVIFLKKDEKTGECVNATNRVNLNTFGANIHTLLSHGFFMKDGLMGEFAKGKIDKAIQYLNQKSLSKEEIDYCENIIYIIGEPIIKNQLQRILDSKRLSKIDNLDRLEEELEFIKHRIEMIRKKQ
ncbi:MAG: ATP-binding protein [Sulfurimonas sp.]|nr:ATP-binding protein [Sulfurimonas sp.]